MRSRSISTLVLLCCFAACRHAPAHADDASSAQSAKPDIVALFAKAEEEGRLGLARKAGAVDARPARAGEIVVTVIAGEGVETKSPPAQEGDMVLRNRCPETGNEQHLVRGKKFADRYEGPTGPAAADGWAPFKPRGVEMQYFVIPQGQEAFTFTAPWGEEMVARAGDSIVRDPNHLKDIYRIARAAFACTYEITKPPKS